MGIVNVLWLGVWVVDLLVVTWLLSQTGESQDARAHQGWAYAQTPHHLGPGRRISRPDRWY